MNTFHPCIVYELFFIAVGSNSWSGQLGQPGCIVLLTNITAQVIVIKTFILYNVMHHRTSIPWHFDI